MKKVITLLFVLIGPSATENGRENILNKLCFTFLFSQMQSLDYCLRWVLRTWKNSQDALSGQHIQALLPDCILRAAACLQEALYEEEIFLLGLILTEDLPVFKQQEGSPLTFSGLFPSSRFACK